MFFNKLKQNKGKNFENMLLIEIS